MKPGIAQVELNKVESQHRSMWVAGWRPFIGWVGGFSLAYAGILHPLLMWLWTLLQAAGVIPKEVNPPPFVETGILGTIVTGLLGIGGMRFFDKSKGNSTDSIKQR